MANYAFQTAEFGLDATGIHLLRNRFHYHSIPYAEADKVHVSIGPDIQNWGLVLGLGILLAGAGILGCYALYWFFQEEEGRIDVKLVVAPFLPLVLGAMAVVSALRRVPTLQLEQHGRQRRISLRELAQKGHLHELTAYLQQQGVQPYIEPQVQTRCAV